jgi:transposase-like protein
MEHKSQKPKTLQEVIQYFSDEQTCIDTVAAFRWSNGKPVCPACLALDNAYYLATQKRWKCKECGRQFSVKLDTIFEDSPIPLTKWLPALWMLVNCKNGISSYEVASDLGITQKSAWFMMHRLRLGLQDKKGFGAPTKLGGPESEVEVDETFVGGKKRNMHADRALRYEQKGGAQGKAIVMGLLDRDLRKVRATVVANVKRDTLQAEVLQQVKYGTKVYTDDAVAYDKLHWRFVHEVVNKTESYVRGRVHVNGMENFWSLLKRGLNGTYVAVEPFHLFRYVDEQAFRYNNREATPADRFELALSQVANKRLTLAEVTGKIGETSS